MVAAHADDEVLGCGGTIAKHVANGDQVELIIMTDGVSSRGTQDSTESELRRSMLKSSCELLGIHNVHQYKFPDNQMDSVPILSLIQSIEKHVFELKPNLVYTHCSTDLNIDHQLTHRAVMTACRPQPEFPVEQILTFEVRSGTDWQPASQMQFVPNWFIDISQQWSQKEQALNAYDKEIKQWPHSRSTAAVKAQAESRGAQIGVTMAEAFVLERYIEK